MATVDTYVRARIDAETKLKASNALAAMGLSVSDAIRLLMVRIAEEHRLPFEIKVPNNATFEAMQELETNGGEKFDSVEDLLTDLNADD